MKNIAIDAGFGRTKAADKNELFDFPSLTANFTGVQYSTGMETGNLTSHLVLEHEGKAWFIGDAAAKQGIAQRTVDKERAVSKEGKLLSLAALGLLSGDKVQHFNLVAGLPVSHYAGLKERYISNMKATHYFSFISMTGKEQQDFVANVHDVKVIPQPIGTLFNLLLDDAAEVVNPQLAVENVGIIDVGYFTVDIVRADGLEFIGQSSKSYPLGLFTAYSELADALNEHLNIETAPESLESVMTSGRIVVKGSGYDVQSLVSKAQATAADQIISRVKTLWSKSGWQIDKVIVTGGGGKVLHRYLQAVFDAELAPDPFYSNVNGYMKLAEKSWKDG